MEIGSEIDRFSSFLTSELFGMCFRSSCVIVVKFKEFRLGFRPQGGSSRAMDEAAQRKFVADNMDSDLQFVMADSGVLQCQDTMDQCAGLAR